MIMDVISKDGAPIAIGPYSQAVRAGDFLFCSGQLGIDVGTGGLVGDDIESQTAQALKNLAEVLRAGGLDMSDVVKTTVFLADMDDFPLVNELYAARFGTHKPARATVQVARLPLDALIEIECTACSS